MSALSPLVESCARGNLSEAAQGQTVQPRSLSVPRARRQRQEGCDRARLTHSTRGVRSTKRGATRACTLASHRTGRGEDSSREQRRTTVASASEGAGVQWGRDRARSVAGALGSVACASPNVGDRLKGAAAGPVRCHPMHWHTFLGEHQAILRSFTACQSGVLVCCVRGVETIVWRGKSASGVIGTAATRPRPISGAPHSLSPLQPPAMHRAAKTAATAVHTVRHATAVGHSGAEEQSRADSRAGVVTWGDSAAELSSICAHTLRTPRFAPVLPLVCSVCVSS